MQRSNDLHKNTIFIEFKTVVLVTLLCRKIHKQELKSASDTEIPTTTPPPPPFSTPSLSFFSLPHIISSNSGREFVFRVADHLQVQTIMVLLVYFVLLLALTGHASALYCVCKDGLSDQALQKTLDYACGAGADCTPILQNAACYQPNTVKDHCSYAVNSYFQRKGQAQGSCDFAGTATTTQTAPASSTGCVFPASPSNTGTGTTATPTATPTTGISGTPPSTTSTTTPTSTTPGTSTGTGTGIGTSPTFGISPTATTTGTGSGFGNDSSKGVSLLEGTTLPPLPLLLLVLWVLFIRV